MGMESVYKLSVFLNLVDNVSDKLGSVQKNTSQSIQKMNDAFGSLQKAGTVMAGAGAAILGTGAALVSSTFDTQGALGELASLGVEDLKAVEKAAKNFSDTWAGTTKADFISASYDIKSGIASLSDEGVAKFTELAALTGKATKSTTGEMSSLFATGYGIYKDAYEDMSDLEFGAIFSAGISTAVKNYKTAGSEMAASISTLGATATNNQVPLEEQLAILGQLQTTMSGSEAATKYKSFLNQASAAGEKLGVTFTDTNNNLLSTPEILDKLKGKYGDTLDAVEKRQLKEAFGTDEAIAMIDLLYGNVDTLRGGIDDMADSMQSGIDVTEKMAKTINSTPDQKFKVLKQKIHNNTEELAQGLLPALNNVMDGAGKLIGKFGDWVSKNQETVGTIMRIVMFLGIFLSIAGVAGVVIGTLGKAFLLLRGGINRVRSSFSKLSLSMLTNPVFLVVVGILALVAAFVVLWNKCEGFRNFWKELFQQVQAAFSGAWDKIQPALKGLMDSFRRLKDACQPLLEVLGIVLGTVLTGALGLIVGFVTGAAQALGPLISAFSHLVDFVSNVINAIGALFSGDFSGALDFACAAVDNLVGFFTDGFNGILDFLGGFASGFLDTIGGALKAVGVNAKEQIGKLKDTIGNGLGKVKDFFSKTFSKAGEIAKDSLKNIKSAYEKGGGGLKGAAAVALGGIQKQYVKTFGAIDKLTGGKLSAMKQKFSQNMDGIKGAVNKGLGTAKKFADKHLQGMVKTFRENGGGMKGAAAVAMENVKGVFNKGYNVINNLTGGRLEKIKNAFTSKMAAARDGVKNAIEKIKGFFKFEWSLPKLKMPKFSIEGGFSLNPPSVPHLDVKWNAAGGIMTKPTFFGAAGNTMFGGGEAGDEAILPLELLWGKMHSILKGILQTDREEDGKEQESSYQVLTQAAKKKEKKTSKTEEKQSAEKKRESGNVYISNLNLSVDVSKIKDLPLLFKLLDELKDAQNRTEDTEPGFA